MGLFNGTVLVTPTVFLLDVDGVMTDGKFYYTTEGKVMKAFGPDDHEALALLDSYLHIHFVTGDFRGLEISKARIVTDMNRPLDLVSTKDRIDWIRQQWDPTQVIYMGDGLYDHRVFEHVLYGIAPANADRFTQSKANFVTQSAGGNRAVAEASLHILTTFFAQSYPHGV